MPEIYEGITAIFGLLLAGVLRHVLARLKQAEGQVKRHEDKTEEELFSEGVKNIRLNIREFNSVAKTITKASKDTKIDRVLVLVGVNGTTKPNRATVLWDDLNYEPTLYEDVALDADYQDRFEYITKNSHLQFRTDDPECANSKINEWYSLEGVVSSIWMVIAKKSSHNTEQVAYMYMSCSSHNQEEMGNPEIRAGQNIAALMRQVVSTHGYRSI